MKRNLKMILASLFVGIFAATGLLIPAFADDGEYSGPIRVFVLDDDSLKDENSAPYDVNSLRSLFENAGFSVTVINAEQFACFDDFNANICDVLMLPTGEAFPYKAAENFKRYLADGGKLITSGGYAFKNTIYSPDGGASVEGGKSLGITSAAKGDSHSVTHRLGKDTLKPGESYTISFDIKYSNIVAGGGFAHASTYFYDSGNSMLPWKDFMTLTEGESDWKTISHTFTFPTNANTIAFNLGFYRAQGKVEYDNLTVRSSSGEVVYSDDFENGTGDWTINTGSASAVSVGTGISHGGDMAIVLVSDSAKANASFLLDNVGSDELDIVLDAAYNANGKTSGAYIEFFKGGKSVESAIKRSTFPTIPSTK